MAEETLVSLEIDGLTVEVPPGTSVIEAAEKLGIVIPHFCYHPKLPVAANCRMCLVEMEKSRKPVPACATPVAPGMKIYTQSPLARRAQRGVMEFLLINHPLDCPVCDQGGECPLQDQALGWGGSSSRYALPKRAVANKDIGPLIATEMTRCILCTRCVRFGETLGGVREMGVVGRGEHAEITSFLETSITSEVSGNMIDVCPVGALTSKPYRFTARPWELAWRFAVSPHDPLGSNLWLQEKAGAPKRVLPKENPNINDFWLSDRDRFSYEALMHPDRLLAPVLRRDGQWAEVSWEEAMRWLGKRVLATKDKDGAQSLGFLASPSSTSEELYLFSRIAQALGCDNFDTRLRQVDFSLEAVPGMGTHTPDIKNLKSLFLAGCDLRNEIPLLALFVREAARKGLRVSSLSPLHLDLRLPMQSLATPPSALAQAAGQWLLAIASATKKDIPKNLAALVQGLSPSPEARALADSSLIQPSAVWAGQMVLEHPQAGAILALLSAGAEMAGALFGILPWGANAVGAALLGLPESGLNARQMWEDPRRGYFLFGFEPAVDTYCGALTRKALKKANWAVAFSSWKLHDPDIDLLLPITPFAETSGTLVNLWGDIQTQERPLPPRGQAKAGVEALLLLASELGLEDTRDMDFVDVQAAALQELANLEERLGRLPLARIHLSSLGGHFPRREAAKETLKPAAWKGERVGQVPLYAADGLVRRSPALQRTPLAVSPCVRVHPQTLASLKAHEGETVQVTGEGGQAVLPIFADPCILEGCAWLPGGLAETQSLGPLFGEVRLERLGKEA